MKKLILILPAVLLVLAGCGGTEETKDKIRIGIMPDAGALPLLVMDDVEIVSFLSAKERDTAMQLGELDGMMSDLVAVVTFNQRDIPMRVLTLTESRFLIVGTPDFTEDQEWSIGISENTVIEYLADQFGEGYPMDKVSIPQVPVRMEMLGSKKIPLACLTDAMAWPLLSRGFQIVRDQQDSGLDPAILAFSQEFLDRSEKRLDEFKKEWNRAVEKINENPEEYRALLMEHARIPEIEGFPYPVPEYRPILLPGEDQVDSVISWYDDKFGLNREVGYGEMMIP